MNSSTIEVIVYDKVSRYPKKTDKIIIFIQGYIYKSFIKHAFFWGGAKDLADEISNWFYFSCNQIYYDRPTTRETSVKGRLSLWL